MFYDFKWKKGFVPGNGEGGGGAAERGRMRKAFLGIGMLKKQVYFVK